MVKFSKFTTKKRNIWKVWKKFPQTKLERNLVSNKSWWMKKQPPFLKKSISCFFNENVKYYFNGPPPPVSFPIICFSESYQTLLSHKIKEIETRNQKKTMGDWKRFYAKQDAHAYQSPKT